MHPLRVSCLGLSLLMAGCFAPVSDSAQDTTVDASPSQLSDNFVVSTTDGCGRIEFVKLTPGAPITNNYLVVHNLCGDNHGVKVWAWLNGAPLGSKSAGLPNAPTIWAPFPSGTLAPGDAIGLKVCLSDGATSPTFSRCGSLTRTSLDS
jgi:hypothetical protein